MKACVAAALLIGLSAPGARAQEDHSGHGSHAGHATRQHAAAMRGLYGPYYPMSREASGTAWAPDSTPHEGVHVTAAGWMGMVHGYAFGVYDHQGGKRGEDRAFSENMLMLMAQRPAGAGILGLRAMLSLEPAMGPRGYPLLLQTGETADGERPLIDRQHPHDLFMELAVSYSHPVSEDSSVFAYAGLPGEPALGPAAFMHRFSGADNPEAPLSHHWLDSTHITFGVLTGGWTWRNVKAEASAFQGREPDQGRWNIESPKLDSYSARFTVNPGEDWSLQASYGDLDSPEQLEPDVDVQRFTASAAYNRRFGRNNWQTTLAWGRNVAEHAGHSEDEDAYLLESALRLRDRYTVFGRLENVDKHELFVAGEPLAGRTFNVSKANLGFIYDFASWRKTQWGVGATGSAHFIPRSLENVYGETPLSYMLFLRAKLGTG